MISAILEYFKQCGIKRISITALIFIVASVGVVVLAGDKRYMLKTEAQQMQHFQEEKLEIEIMMLQMKLDGSTQEQIDKATKDKYQKMLDELNAQKEKG